MKIVLVTAFAMLAATAGAQTVWRCGADGRSYSDTACPVGRVVAVADTRDSAQIDAARAVAARDRALAHELTRERQQLERETAVQGSGLTGIQSLPRPALKAKAATLARAKKHSSEGTDIFRAIGPASR